MATATTTTTANTIVGGGDFIAVRVQFAKLNPDHNQSANSYLEHVTPPQKIVQDNHLQIIINIGEISSLHSSKFPLQKIIHALHFHKY